MSIADDCRRAPDGLPEVMTCSSPVEVKSTGIDMMTLPRHVFARTKTRQRKQAWAGLGGYAVHSSQISVNNESGENIPGKIPGISQRVHVRIVTDHIEVGTESSAISASGNEYRPVEANSSKDVQFSDEVVRVEVLADGHEVRMQF